MIETWSTTWPTGFRKRGSIIDERLAALKAKNPEQVSRAVATPTILTHRLRMMVIVLQFFAAADGGGKGKFSQYNWKYFPRNDTPANQNQAGIPRRLGI
ncbi:MAG: hypothetical protein H7Y17_03535 [Chlorobia bacterium]|nr:hypothetical protein [Fimbriimonadaceae bacterium]